MAAPIKEKPISPGSKKSMYVYLLPSIFSVVISCLLFILIADCKIEFKIGRSFLLADVVFKWMVYGWSLAGYQG